MRPIPALLLWCTVVACSRSNGSTVLTAATIGPAGGELMVTSGQHSGLKLVVPAGAMSEPVELRILEVPRPLFVGSAASVSVTPPGEAFRIEPESLRLDEVGTLEAPYRPAALQNTAAGNVRFEQTRDGITRLYDPASVDVVEGRVSMPIRTFGRYQVVPGPRAQSLDEYRPALGSTVALENLDYGNVSFAVEEIPADAPVEFRTSTAQRWRIRGQGFDESLYVDGDLALGRDSAPGGWVEVWTNPALVWQDLRGPQPFAVTTAMSVRFPTPGTSTSGLMTVFGTWNWSEPRFVGPTQLFDVLQLSVSLAWDRPDLGAGQRVYRFLFAPGVGLVLMVRDGLAYARTVL